MFLIDSVAEILALPQIILVLLIALVLFGPQRLPEIGRQLGAVIRQFRKASNDLMNNFTAELDPEIDTSARYDYQHTNGTVPYSSYSRPYYYNAPVDLTDYTIAGQPIKETRQPTDLTDYTLSNFSSYSGPALENSAASGYNSSDTGSHSNGFNSASPSEPGLEPKKEG
jgi:sec-independent protein translocase protein TatA